MNDIITALSHTPTWVYILFAYLVWIGISASRARVVPVKKLYIMPIIFAYLSVNTLMTSFAVGEFEMITWIGSLLLGKLLGWRTVESKAKFIKVDRKKHLISLPGTWATLILILIIFATKYYFSYELAIDPTLSSQTSYEFSMLAISGLCAGFSLGRLFAYLKLYYGSPQTDLIKTS